MTYRLQVTNLGPATASAAWLHDPIPGGAEFVNVTTSQGSCTLVTGNAVECQFGDLPASGTVQVRVVVRPVQARRLVNIVSVGADQPDPNTVDNLVKTRNNVIGTGLPG